MLRRRIDPIVPSDQEATLARTAHLALESDDSVDAGLRVRVVAPGGDSKTLDLPPIVSRLLMDILKETAAGKAVSLVSIETEITTQQAADLLNVSRPFLIGMIDKGVLPARMVGNQRRLPLRDVLVHKAETYAKQREALREMTKLDQELGLI